MHIEYMLLIYNNCFEAEITNWWDFITYCYFIYYYYIYSAFNETLFCTAVVDDNSLLFLFLSLSLSLSLSLCICLSVHPSICILHYYILYYTHNCYYKYFTNISAAVHSSYEKIKSLFDTYYRTPRPSYPCNKLYPYRDVTINNICIHCTQWDQ